MMHVSIVHPIPSPYRESLFAELANFYNIELSVYYCAKTMAGYRDWQFSETAYHREFLPGRELGKGLLFNPIILKRLKTERPDILAIWGWSYPTAQLALLTARVLQIPTLVFSASAVPLHQSPTGFSAELIRYFKQLLIKLPQGFLVPGKLAQQYLLSFNVTANRIHVLPINCLDTQLWRRKAEAALLTVNEQKQQLGIQSKRIMLYVGRLVSGKGLPVLLDAYEAMQRRVTDTALVIVGGGSEKRNLETSAQRKGLSEVHFLGAQPYEALPQLYGFSDCLVLPTLSDQWPLVVLEAMACGLPVVTTTHCGIVPDVIDGRETGLVVEPGDPEALARAMEEIISLSPLDRKAIRQKVFATAAEYDYRVAAKQLADVFSLELDRASKNRVREV